MLEGHWLHSEASSPVERYLHWTEVRNALEAGYRVRATKIYGVSLWEMRGDRLWYKWSAVEPWRPSSYISWWNDGSTYRIVPRSEDST